MNTSGHHEEAMTHDEIAEYKWDDGLSPIWPVVDDPATDFGTALLICWRIEGPWLRETFKLSFGCPHVLYPQANDRRCTTALLLDVDPIAMVQNRRGPKGDRGTLDQYVNDRPYVASSSLSVAIAQVHAGEHKVEVWPYLGSGIRMDGKRGPALLLQNKYGLLDLGLPPVQTATALPSGNKLLRGWWNQLYLLDFEQRRLGRAANGDQCVPRTPEFRVTLAPARG
jgi:hypothetical protein